LSIDRNRPIRKVKPADELLNTYDLVGFKLIRLGRSNRPIDEGWHNGHVSRHTVREHAERGGAIGVQTGPLSGHLAVVDLDGPFTAELASRFLPETLTGRKGRDLPTHYYYFSEGLNYRQFGKLGGGEQIAVKASNNGAGHLVVAPPTRHPKKGPYQFVGGFDPNRIARVGHDDLIRAVGLLSAAALIGEHLVETGGRHAYSLALSEFLVRNGVAPGDVLRVLETAWEVRGGDTSKLRANVEDSARKVAANEPTTGGRTLEEIVPGLAGRLAKSIGADEPNMGENQRRRKRVSDFELFKGWMDQNPHIRPSMKSWYRYRTGFWG
jgi:hypothetical protein